jgi:hypothetical protein
MKYSENLNLSLYETTDKMSITADENSLNANMNIIDNKIKELEDKIAQLDNTAGGISVKLRKGDNITSNPTNATTIIETEHNL